MKNKNNLLRFGIATMSLFGALTAQAAVLYYDLRYYGVFEQTDDNVPPDSFFYATYASVYADAEGDLLAGELTLPDLSTTPLYYATSQLINSYSQLYASIAELTAAYPSGSYGFSVTAGNAAPGFGSLEAPIPDFPNEIPYLTDGSFSALQNSASYVDKTVTWYPFTHNGSTALQYQTIYLYDYVNGIGNVFIDYGLNTSFTSTTFPAELMRSGHAFAYTLVNNAYDETANAGFGNATGTVMFMKQTNGEFYVLADPGTVSGQIELQGYVYPTYYPIEVEVEIPGGGIDETINMVNGFLGHYAVDCTSRDVRNLRFKAPRFLSRVLYDIDLSVGNDHFDVQLLNGDVDMDNEVTLVDFGLVSAAFGSIDGDPNWNPDADLDGDGEVTLVDYSFIASNFGLAGE